LKAMIVINLTIREFIIISLIVFNFAVHKGFSQQIYYNPNDERFKALYLEKVQSEYQVQQEEFNRQKQLHEQGLISEKEFRESAARFKNAELTYQQAILSLAFEQPHITIDKAIKYQAKNGEKRVKLTLRNTTGNLIEGRKVEFFEGIHTDQISNVYVSLLNDQNAIISQPYEAKIATLLYDQPVKLDFLLLQDLDYVVVKSVYGSTSEEKKIFLQKDVSANRVLITSQQYSQEADLGTYANYGLSLELFSHADNEYKLEILNLPNQITYEFIDTQTNARLSHVRFSQNMSTRELSLLVYLPERYDSSSFIIDQPIHFFAAAILQADMGSIDRGATYSANKLEQQNVSYVRLELVPRGRGLIQVHVANLYHEVSPSEEVHINLTIYNDGTRRLDNIKVKLDVPLNWVSSVTPDLIPSLLPGKEAIVSLTVTPAKDVSVGDYEVIIKTESIANNRKVQSEDKRIRIHVSSTASFWGTAVLIVLLVGTIIGVVAIGIRLSRK